MDYVEAVILAVIQGLTEFLPVSSSGHLVLAQHWFGQFNDSHLLYDVMLHLATVTAILVYFREDIVTLVKGYFGEPTQSESVFQGYERQTVHFVLLASIPTALLGIGVELFGFSNLARPSIVAGDADSYGIYTVDWTTWEFFTECEGDAC